jgi:hypothetical protein
MPHAFEAAMPSQQEWDAMLDTLRIAAGLMGQSPDDLQGRVPRSVTATLTDHAEYLEGAAAFLRMAAAHVPPTETPE